MLTPQFEASGSFLFFVGDVGSGCHCRKNRGCHSWLVRLPCRSWLKRFSCVGRLVGLPRLGRPVRLTQVGRRVVPLRGRGFCHACSHSSSLELKSARRPIITHTCYYCYTYQRIFGLTWTPSLIDCLPYISLFLSFISVSALMSFLFPLSRSCPCFVSCRVFIKYSYLVLASRLPVSVLTVA
jgi:hypothetical protein